MTDVTATFTNKETKETKAVTVPYEFGATLADSVKLFGEGVVKALFDAKAVIAVQDTGRRLLAAGKTVDEVKAYIANFKLGVPVKRVGGARKTSAQKMLEAISSGAVSQEDLQSIMAELQKALSAKKAAK